MQPEPPPHKHPARRRVLRWVAVGVFLTTCGVVFWSYHTRGIAVGIVEGEILTLSAPASVTVERVFVYPGQRCEKGQPLVELAAKDASAERSVLEARLSQARDRLRLVEMGAQLEDLQLERRFDDRDRLAAEVAAGEADMTAAQATLNHAERELASQTGLYEQSQASAREFDAAETEAVLAREALNRARSYLAGLRQRWERQRALVPQDSDIPQLRQAELTLSRDAVREAEQRLKWFDFQSGTRIILAPLSGQVDRVYVRPGSHRDEDEPLVRVYDPESLYVTTYVRPRDRGRLQIGSEVRMFPLGGARAITGRVCEIHDSWVSEPRSIVDMLGLSATVVTTRVDCAEADRGILAPGMVLKVVIRGR